MASDTDSESDHDNRCGPRLGQCEVCAKHPARYRCPKCEVKTCCLDCVKIHKKELECDGIRDRTKYIPLRKMTNMDFMSDYYFLEECTRYVEDRKNDPIKKFTYQNKDWPKRLFQLRKAALERKTKVRFLMPHFTRHKENRSHYNWKFRKIFWHVEWVFVNACNAKYVDNGCDEERPLHLLLEKYFDTTPNDKVPKHELLCYYQSAGVFNVKILLKAECIKRSQTRFYLLDASKSLKENLKSKIIVEHPSIYITYDTNLDAFEIIDSDDDVEGETEAYEQELEQLRKEFREAERLTKKCAENESTVNAEEKAKLEEIIAERESKARKRKLKKIESESTNYLFSNENLIDALSSSDTDSDDINNEEEEKKIKLNIACID